MFVGSFTNSSYFQDKVNQKFYKKDLNNSEKSQPYLIAKGD